MPNVSNNVVLILGAGASHAAGAPLMKEFLQVAEDELLHGSDKHAYDRVTKARLELRKAHSKAQLDTTNLESVFSAFELAKQFQQLGALSAAEIDELPKAMGDVIVRTLERRTTWQVDRTTHGRVKLNPDPGSAAVARTLKELRAAGSQVDVLTFNYDIALESALHYEGMNVDYGFAPEKVPASEDVRVCKLHGSINWRACRPCGYLESKLVPEIIVWAERNGLLNTRVAHLEVSKMFAEEAKPCPTCKQPLEHPTIVPPALGKAAAHDQVRIVWQSAVRALEKAQHVVVLGYSWPQSDAFFHYLYGVGTIGDTFLRRVLVINPDAAIEARFRVLFGPEAEQRFDFQALRAEELQFFLNRYLTHGESAVSAFANKARRPS